MWGLVSLAICSTLPIWESRDMLYDVFLHLLGRRWAFPVLVLLLSS